MEYYGRPTIPDGRTNGFLTMPDDQRNGYLTKQDDGKNGFIAVDKGSYFEVVPIPEARPPPPGLFSYIWTIPGSYLTSWMGRTSKTPRLEGRSPAGGVRVDVPRPPTYDRRQDSEHSRRPESNHRPYADFESRGVNGAHLGKVDTTSREIDDRQRFPARNEAHIIERLENEIKHLEHGMKDLEIDFRAKTKGYYLEKMRADDFDKENREYQGRLRGLSLEKIRADNLERENRELQAKLRGLYSEKKRADVLEKENREYQERLKGFSLEKVRAENLEKENRELQEMLKALNSEKMRAESLEIENREFQEKLNALHSEKIRADNLERENREFQGKLNALHSEKIRAESLERENREFQEKLNALHSEKIRADNLERENREFQEKLNALHSERIRADNLERENREFQEKLNALHSERIRADNLERENRGYQGKLKTKEKEVGELQRKLQSQANALESIDTELKKIQNSFQSVRRENQELKGWKLEQEMKMESDVSTTGLLDRNVSELTTANGQLEKQKQQLTMQVQEQTKRIQDLKQQASVLEVKMGAKDSESQSLRERLRDERDKSSKLNDALQQRNNQIEELMEVAQDLEQRNGKLMAAQVMTAESNEAQDGNKEPRERALKAQFSALQAQVGSKEVETQSLKMRLREELENTAKLSEKLQQCDLEIEDLKHQIRDLARGEYSDSVDFLPPPPPPPPKDYIGGESFLETEATPYLLDGAVQRVHELAGIFARLLMKAMEQGRIDGMAVARNSFVRSISVGKAAPLKYVLEAITCKLLFQGFEHECFDLQDSASGFLDMEQQRIDNFREYKYLSSIESPEQLVLTGDSLFSHFCRTKLESLSAAIPEIEGMVQEIIARTFEHSFSSSDASPDIASFLAAKLGVTFVKLAVCVWQVHKLVFSFNPMARIFRVAQSEKFVEKYMESVIFQESESDEDDDMVSADISRVDFMVVPGFLINRIVIRSRVFVVTKPLSRAFWIPNGS